MSKLTDIFRCFIITNEKRPIRKYLEPANQYTYEQIRNLPEYAGLLSANAALVDIDIPHEGDVLLDIIKSEKLKCRVHRTKGGGIHAFFMGHHMPETKTKTSSAIGLNTDWKLGTRNGYAVLKRDGVDLEVVYDTDELGPMPGWLYPIAKMPPDFLTMGEGDGRNDTLYNYILTLKRAGLTKDEIKETIRIINTYVLKAPLPERELKTILRDDAFPSDSFYDEKGKLKVRQFEEHFCREVHALKLDGILHIYRDGVYLPGEEAIRGRMLDFLPDLTMAQRTEILNRSKDRIQTKGKRAPAYLILFRNGTYNMTTRTIQPSSPDNVIVNLIDWNYNPNAYSEVTDRTLDKLACGDPNIRALLEEIIGYCFYRRNELGKSFILLGDASNGKSTYLDVLAYILGDDNISSLALQQFGEKFETAEMHNRLANIGDDIPDTWVSDPSIFKKIVTGDRLTVQRKQGHPFQVNLYVKPILSANYMPRIDDKTGAVMRRLVPVPFNAVFSPDDPDFDPYIKDKLKSEESIEYLIRLGIEGLHRVLTNKRFSINDEIKSELHDINMMNNPLLEFIEEVGTENIINHTTKEVYGKYRHYCVECGLQPVAIASFVKQMNAKLNTTSVRRMVKGEMFKVFVPKQ